MELREVKALKCKLEETLISLSLERQQVSEEIARSEKERKRFDFTLKTRAEEERYVIVSSVPLVLLIFTCFFFIINFCVNDFPLLLDLNLKNSFHWYKMKDEDLKTREETWSLKSKLKEKKFIPLFCLFIFCASYI